MRGSVKRGANLRAEFVFVSIGFCLLLKISIEFYQKKKKKKGRDKYWGLKIVFLI